MLEYGKQYGNKKKADQSKRDWENRQRYGAHEGRKLYIVLKMGLNKKAAFEQ